MLFLGQRLAQENPCRGNNITLRVHPIFTCTYIFGDKLISSSSFNSIMQLLLRNFLEPKADDATKSRQSIREILHRQRGLLQQHRRSLEDRRLICHELCEINKRLGSFKILHHTLKAKYTPQTKIVVHSQPYFDMGQKFPQVLPEIHKEDHKETAIRTQKDTAETADRSKISQQRIIMKLKIREEPLLTPNTKHKVENWLYGLSPTGDSAN